MLLNQEKGRKHKYTKLERVREITTETKEKLKILRVYTCMQIHF